MSALLRFRICRYFKKKMSNVPDKNNALRLQFEFTAFSIIQFKTRIQQKFPR